MTDGGRDQRFAIRDGVAEDTLDLARLALMAGHGLLDIFYRGLIPGKPTLEIVAERRIGREGSYGQPANWRVAEDGNRRMLGALNAFPCDLLQTAAPDPLIGADRLAAVAALSELEAESKGTFYINMIAVFPERRGGGIGAALMTEAERLARRAGFRRMTLSTYEADTRLVEFYRRQGFHVHTTRPIVPHPGLEQRGNWALTARDLKA